uniref:FBA_2 domain-containing protein n=2 Tax=Caenorhabditis tropicalis TaxID=1561998 RepID=A0A1I7TUK3_9PELO
MTTFPLFHLPLVAMEHVLCILNPFELIKLSLTSSKAKNDVKKFKTRFRVLVYLTENPRVQIKGKSKKKRRLWEYCWTIDKSMTTNNHNVFYFLENPIKDMMKRFSYIQEVLRCHIEYINFDLHYSPTENKLITDWLRSLQKSVDKIVAEAFNQKFDDDLKYLLSNITVSKKLWLRTTRHRDDFELEIPQGLLYLNVSNSRFIKYGQLLRLKAVNIILRESILTSQEISGFLKSWMSGESHLDLDAFQINVSGPEAMEEIMDLSDEMTTDPNVMEKMRK